MYGKELVDLPQRMVRQRDDEAKNALSMFMIDPQERDVIVAREALRDTKHKAFVDIFVDKKSSHNVLSSNKPIKQGLEGNFTKPYSPLNPLNHTKCEAD
ncbi:hypothetical protein HS088_TW23G00461 [Tripterygium wilfordii]|uniref:Uncharacterized protein n=1 Tax=Tripterygium wilfordii TaxID=458696 RepID=A0A7J7BV53_TRIWF|nr:hypothetical protein HS088_TW23G00461 [Tripterygium wilfordii]